MQQSLFEFEVYNKEEAINMFIQDNTSCILNFDEFLKQITNNKNIHNHTVENLFLYFDLLKAMNDKKVIFFKKALLFLNARKYKLFVFDEENILVKMNFDSINKCEDLKSRFLIYSSTQLKEKELFTESKYKECVYNLADIFNEKTYEEKYKDLSSKKIKKKIYNRIKYPFAYLNTDKFKHSEITNENLNEVNEIHSKWVKHKLADERTFQIMFSSKRYMFCVNEVMTNEYLKNKTFYKKIFYWEDKPIAVRLCLIDKNKSFDIAFFSLFFECPSNLILYINAFCLKDLKDNYNVETHNCGMELNKLLKTSKEHFPSTHLIGYKYNFKNK